MNNALASVQNINGRRLASTTDKYAFIPTARVLDVLKAAGWNVHKMQEARVRQDSGRAGFQKHIVRLRHLKDFGASGVVPEVLLINSHDGTSGFRFSVGLFEMVCLNGLVAAREIFQETRVRHIGYADLKVNDALEKVVSEIPAILQTRQTWQEIDVTPQEQNLFAETALSLRDNAETHVIHPTEVLRVRHREQAAPTLWNTFNRVQEGIIKGGVTMRNTETNKRRRSREITNISENTRLNTALWSLTERMAALKGQ